MKKNCDNCTEKCPQAKMAHQTALGRMYAVKEFIELLKKVENGELVEVVRCKDCKHCRFNSCYREVDRIEALMAKAGMTFAHNAPTYPVRNLEDFCSYGERKDQ